MSGKISMLLIFRNISETKVHKDTTRKLLLPCEEGYETPIKNLDKMNWYPPFAPLTFQQFRPSL